MQAPHLLSPAFRRGGGAVLVGTAAIAVIGFAVVSADFLAPYDHNQPFFGWLSLAGRPLQAFRAQTATLAIMPDHPEQIAGPDNSCAT